MDFNLRLLHMAINRLLDHALGRLELDRCRKVFGHFLSGNANQ